MLLLCISLCLIPVPSDPQLDDFASATPPPDGPLWVRPIIQNMDIGDTDKSNPLANEDFTDGPGS